MTIHIIPIGPIDPNFLVALQEGLQTVFNQTVDIQPSLPIPESALEKERYQYHAEKVIRTLLAAVSTMVDERSLGIINRDLYVPRLNFVFGIAARNVALISIARLRQGFYNLPDDRALLLRRTLAEAVHELGHTFGLGHCTDPTCTMFFSNSIRDTDRKKADFCPRCRRVLLKQKRTL